MSIIKGVEGVQRESTMHHECHMMAETCDTLNLDISMILDIPHTAQGALLKKSLPPLGMLPSTQGKKPLING